MAEARERAGVREVGDADFAAEVLGCEMPVLVQFTGEWCPSCRMLGPVLARYADEHADRVEVRAVDVDRSPETTLAYGVMAVPALVLFKNGEPVFQAVGTHTRVRLEKELAPYL